MASTENLVSASYELLTRQLEHEERICSGAKHILESKETTSDLRSHIAHELYKSTARIAKIREQLQSQGRSTSSDVKGNDDYATEVVADGSIGLAISPEAASISGLITLKGDEKENGGSTRHLNAILRSLMGIDSQKDLQKPEDLLGMSTIPMSGGHNVIGSDVANTRSATSGKRSAQRNRTLAQHLGRTQQGRIPSIVKGLDAVNQRKLALLLRATSILRKNVRSRYEFPTSLLPGVFICLSDSSGKEVRTAAYRLLRYLVVRPPWKIVVAYKERGLDLYLVRTFLRDSRFLREKEEALKLIRYISDAGQACVEMNQALGTTSTVRQHELLSPTIIRALVAAAEGADDPARYLYLETLAEVAVYDVKLLCESGGLRLLLSYISDPCSRIGPEILSVCLHLLDVQCTRHYFDSRCDVISIFAGFIAPTTTDHVSLKGTARATCNVLQSWSGLLYCCLDGASVLKALLEALRVNSLETQEAILGMLRMLLALGPTATETSANSDRTDATQSPGTQRKERSVFNICDSYFLLLTIVLLDNGLLDALLHLIEERSPLTSSAIDLLQKLSDNAKHSLPAEYMHRIHALPEVFQMRFTGTSENGCMSERERASSIFSTLEEHSFRHYTQWQLLNRRLRSSSITTQCRTNAQVDDTTFRTLLLEANVLSSKDFAKWNVEALQSLFESVLVNAKRLEEAMRASKLVRRVLSFYHPFAMRFSATARTQSNLRFVKLGCTVIETLLTTKEGARFLGEDQLLKDIGDCLSTDVMSEQRFKDTLVSGYFDMLGILSSKVEGRQLMAQANIYTALTRLQDRRMRIDLMQSILSNIDFTCEGQNRLLLSRAMSSHSRTLREFAIRKTCEIIMADPQRWLIRLLVNALYDTVIENRDLASSLLLRACTQSDRILEMVVSMKPKLDQCLHSLFLKFLSTERGFDFLKDGDYIDREMDDWYNYRNLVYSSQLEAKMVTAFDAQGGDDQQRWSGDVPPHFYGELVKTKEGCALLESRGHFFDFVRFVRTHASEESDHEVLQKVKSILWALAHIGTSTGGLPLLEREEVIAIMIWIAENSTVSSLRGASYFALNLIASTEAGAELIQDAGWRISVSTALHRGDVYAFCMPSQDFLRLPRWTVQHPSLPPPSSIDSSLSKVHQMILKHVAGLGNSIIAAKASRSLARLKQRYPSSFRLDGVGKEAGEKSSNMMESEVLFTQILHLLDTRPFRQSIRRYLWELFDFDLDFDLVQRLLLIRKAFEDEQDAVSFPQEESSVGSANSGCTQADGNKIQLGHKTNSHFFDEEDMTDASESDDSDEARLGRREGAPGSSASERRVHRTEESRTMSAVFSPSKDDTRRSRIPHAHANANGRKRRPNTPKKTEAKDPTRRIVGGFSVHEDGNEGAQIGRDA